MTTTIKSVELDLSRPLAVAFICADRKENAKKQSEMVREKAEAQGFQIVEEFQAVTFPKETNRDKVFIEAFGYLFNNIQLVQTLYLATDYVLGEDSISQSLLSILRNQLGVDVLYAVEDF